MTLSSEGLSTVVGDIWINNQIVSNVAEFCDECGNRFAGTPSELAGRDYLLKTFQSLGFENVHLETCTYVGWKRGACRFKIPE